MKTVKDYLMELKEQEKTLIPNSFSDMEWLTPYFEAAEYYDLEYGGVVFPNLALVSHDIIIVDALVRTCVRANAYKWEKLYKTTLLEYNPIWNVDGTEIEEHEIGERKTTNNYDNSKSTATASQVPDDMTSEKEVAKNVSEMDAREDVVTEAEAFDKITRTRSGNIGVTKTQDMINDERDVADFNYIKVIMTDVINAISYPYYVED